MFHKFKVSNYGKKLIIFSMLTFFLTEHAEGMCNPPLAGGQIRVT